MSRPVVMYEDVERLVIDVLEDLLDDHETSFTVGVGVPTGWTAAAPPHFQVSCDGTFAVMHHVAVRSTVRITVWATSTGEAKRLANLALGLIDGYTGEPAMRVSTGILPAQDPDTNAEIASITATVTVRSTPL